MLHQLAHLKISPFKTGKNVIIYITSFGSIKSYAKYLYH